MAKVEFNKANCEQLPINDVSPSIFTITITDNEEAETELDGSSHEVAEETEHSSGGSSLLRTNKEVEEIVITSATVTVNIGGDTAAEWNVNGKVTEALSRNKVLSPSNNNSEIYVVRPENIFVSDSNPYYLEIHFSDLLPFGRVGTGETRRVKILRKALLAYMLNISTRKFFKKSISFCQCMIWLPVNNCQLLVLCARKFRLVDGILSTKAEGFGKITLEDMKKVCEHKINCAKTARKGGTLPPPCEP
jgi:hypothetical protein